MGRLTGLLILTAATMLAACASQAPATSTGAGGEQRAVPTASAATSAHPVPSGYQREVVDGEERFCRNDNDTGSRVQRTKVCLTWDELQAEEKSSVTINRRSGPVN